MAVQYSIQKMISDGTLSTITLGIQYLQRNDIYVRIAGEDTPQSGAPSGYTWSFVDNTTLKILPTVPTGVEVVIYRSTDIDAMYNIYSQNAQFDEATIDENNQQLLYIAQEYLEQGIPGAGIDSLEYINTVAGINYYRFRLTGGSYTNTFGVPDGTVVLRDELSATNGPSIIGYRARNVYERLSAVRYVKDYNTLQDAVASGVASLVFESGTYNVLNSITIPQHCVIHKGAIINVAPGVKVSFTGQIEAGHYKIFNHNADFITDYTQSAPVLISGCNVKAAWFSDKVDNVGAIKSISDQTNNLIAACRAAFGDFTVDGADFKSSIPAGVVDICQGYFRVDKEFSTSKQLHNGKFYKLAGGTIRGTGAGTSVFVRTDLANTEMVFKVGYYTSELTTISGLSVIAYNPDGNTPANKFDSASKCMAFFQGDSLSLSDFWVSGAKIASRVDAKLCYRDGVGIQFNSCIDTHISKIFVEYCVTGIAVASSQITGSEITLFNTLRTAIGLGNFISGWPDSQDTSSTVMFNNIIGANLVNNAITSLEVGALSHIDIHGLFNGYNTENNTQTGSVFTRVSPGTRIRGVISGKIKNWVNYLFSVESQARLGDEGNNVIIKASISNIIGVGAIIKMANDAFSFASVKESSILNCSVGLLDGMNTSSHVSFTDVYLSNFYGILDGSTNRSMFALAAGNLNLERVSRNAADTVTLNQYGYANTGSSVVIDATIANATRVVPGGGSVIMPQYVTFV